MAQTYRNIEELPAMLTVYQLRSFLGIGQRQAYELTHTEGFPALKIGTTIKIPKHLLMDWIKTHLENNSEKGAAT